MNETLLTALSFPLNVYAWALYLEKVSVQYLHYGLWEEKNDIFQAQTKASDYLFEKLPKIPTSLLEVGIGLGTTAKRLVEIGYDYTGVTPDNTQILYARHQHQEPKIKLIHDYFQKVNAEKTFDVILFQESAQYIDINDIFKQCKMLLKPYGLVFIMDEIPAHILPHLNNTLQSWGFKLEDIENLTDQAVPSIAYLIQIIRQHFDQLLYDLNLSVAQLQGLLESLDKRHQAYLNSQYTYHFIKLQKI
jgi:SAM-dependent methyltransferase